LSYLSGAARRLAWRIADIPGDPALPERGLRMPKKAGALSRELAGLLLPLPFRAAPA